MTVRIGHASIDENGRISGGKAGDQTGREVCIRAWYLRKNWVLLRCKDPLRRLLIGDAAEKGCTNDHIGYDQWQRDTLFNVLKENGFDLAAVDLPVEADCSSFVRACVASAFGKDVVGNIRTTDLPAKLVASGLFTRYTGDKYTKSSDYLRRGDILCTAAKGHTVIVLDDGPLACITSAAAAEAARSFDAAVAGVYGPTENLNIRNGAGTAANVFSKDKAVLVNIPEGTAVRCLGAYTAVGSRKWLYVHFELGGVVYTGFASSKYLEKIPGGEA